MEELVIYEKPTCSTCRVAISLLNESGKEYRRVRYHDDRLSAEKLTELVNKLGMRPHEIVRTKERLFKDLNISLEELSDEEVIAMLIANPDLLERPILECGDRAVLGRPSERVAEFLRSLSESN